MKIILSFENYRTTILAFSYTVFLQKKNKKINVLVVDIAFGVDEGKTFFSVNFVAVVAKQY